MVDVCVHKFRLRKLGFDNFTSRSILRVTFSLAHSVWHIRFGTFGLAHSGFAWGDSISRGISDWVSRGLVWVDLVSFSGCGSQGFGPLSRRAVVV